jgi:hypothetical protein
MFWNWNCIETFRGLVERKHWSIDEVIRVAQLDHECDENATQVTPASVAASSHAGNQGTSGLVLKNSTL